MSRRDKFAFFVMINDEKIKRSTEAALILSGFCVSDGADIFVCDEKNAEMILYNAAAGIIVLYESPDYLQSSTHSELQKRFGTGYAYLERPFLYSDLCSAADSVSDEHDTISAEITETAREAVVDRESLCITYRDEKVHLTEREFELFEFLYRRRGELVSRNEISDSVWGDDVSDGTNITEVYISYLRRKLRRVFGDGVIVSVRGKGYILSL